MGLHSASTDPQANISPLTEVEHDHLEQYPAPMSSTAFAHRLLSASPPASLKEGTDEGLHQESEDVKMKERSTFSEEPVTPARKRCIQTDI